MGFPVGPRDIFHIYLALCCQLPPRPLQAPPCAHPNIAPTCPTLHRILDPAIIARPRSHKQHVSHLVPVSRTHIKYVSPTALPQTPTKSSIDSFKMLSAKYTQTYEKVSMMGEKLKAAGKQGPSNDEQLNVRFSLLQELPGSWCGVRRTKEHIHEGGTTNEEHWLTLPNSCTPTPRSQKARTLALRRSLACSTLRYVSDQTSNPSIYARCGVKGIGST